LVLPKAIERGLAVIAMKTLADGRFFSNKTMNTEEVWKADKPVVPGRITLDDAMSFPWTMPVSVVVTGAENTTFLKEKLEIALRYKNLTEKDREEIALKVVDLAKEGKVEYYKQV
jgi:uncharacterized protein